MKSMDIKTQYISPKNDTKIDKPLPIDDIDIDDKELINQLDNL
jgi:hypothetical protein